MWARAGSEQCPQEAIGRAVAHGGCRDVPCWPIEAIQVRHCTHNMGSDSDGSGSDEEYKGLTKPVCLFFLANMLKRGLNRLSIACEKAQKDFSSEASG